MEPNHHLNLNSVHCDLIAEFLKLTQYQQTQRLKSIKHSFKNLLDFKLRDEETYLGDEVREMVTELQDVLYSEIETELKDSSHTSVLLVQQLLAGAEEWHLTLTANISELENREKLDSVNEFSKELNRELEPLKIQVTKTKAVPVQDMTIASRLKDEIVELQAENAVLKGRISEMEEATKNLAQKPPTNDSDLSRDLASAQAEIFNLNEALENALAKGHEYDQVKRALDVINADLMRSAQSRQEEAQRMRQELEAREDKLRSIQSNLLMTEKELEKKFQATSVYVNMKKLMVEKNGVIKGLRAKLAELGVETTTVVQEGSGVNKDDEN